MKILGIETSCDDTGLAIYDSTIHKAHHLLYSQVESHQLYGGVVPELASRDHVRKILPLLLALLEQANCSLEDIDGIGYTQGPGLSGALLVGTTFAKSLAFAINKPCKGIHHLEAHILAVMLQTTAPTFPFLALLVSGGHTMFIYAKEFGVYEVIGQSNDDAVGECFDKTAKLLGLDYPGGPEISKLAEHGDSTRFNFPKPMLNTANLDFSFSGLKTHVRRQWEEIESTKSNQADIAASLESTIVDILVTKTQKALKQTNLTQLVLAGGVAANIPLRKELNRMCIDNKVEFFNPDLEFCTDNGAMVAYTGYRYLAIDNHDDNLSIDVHPRWPIKQQDENT